MKRTKWQRLVEATGGRESTAERAAFFVAEYQREFQTDEVPLPIMPIARRLTAFRLGGKTELADTGYLAP